MDDSKRALQEKLKARREALETGGQKSPTVTKTDSDEEDNIPMLQEQLEDVDETDEASHLKEKLESRHDATRRRLQASEMLSPPPRTLSPVKTEPKKDSVKSPGQSQEFASPRSEGESTLGSTLGRSSGAKSLRSRLQEKLEAAKLKQSQTNVNETLKRSHRLKDKIITSHTRFDDPLRTLSRLEIERERELESKVTAKLLARRRMQKAKGDTGLPTDADCYDFFTKQYEDRPPPPDPESETQPTEEPQPEGETPAAADEEAGPSQEQPTPVPADEPGQEEPAQEGAEAEGEETADEKKKLLDEIIPPELDFKLFSVMPAQYPGYSACVEEEQKVSFVPSVLDAPAESKNLDGVKPVYLEEEGFYVGLMPEVQIRNRNILENRILNQEAVNHKSWFGADGRVRILPNPVRMHPTKPWVADVSDVDRSIETVYVKAYESSVEEKYLEGSEEHELQIDIGMIVFHHHPLMSREHVVAARIGEYYEAYIKHRQKNYAVFYHEKLRTLRLALNTMKKYTPASLDTEDEDHSAGNHALRIQDYLVEIRRTCNQRDQSEYYERDLVKKIIKEWNEIRKLRTTQNFSNTNVKLTVKKQEVDHDADRMDWTKEIDQELVECQEEYEYTVLRPYKRQMVRYQANIQEWKKKRLQLKRQQKLAAARAGKSASQKQPEEEDVLVGANPKPLKPIAPEVFNAEERRQKLISQAIEHRRNPAEAKISLEVTKTHNVTPDTQVPAGELARRRAIHGASILAQVKINGKDVCTSEPRIVTPEFQVHFGQIFKIYISQWPDTVKVQLREAGRLTSPLLDEVFLNVPDASVNSANTQSFPCEFSNDRVVTHNNHEGVGSSTPFKLYPDPSRVPVSLKTRGSLFLSIAWGLTEDGRVLAPKVLTQHGSELHEVRQRPQQNTFGVDGVDIDGLWSQEGKLDPNDPGNAGLVTFGNVQEGFVPAMDFFRLDQLQQQFDFVSDEDLGNMRRLRILEYRSKGVAEFRNLAMVPANEYEIMDSAFTAFERRKREKDSLGDAAERKVKDGILSAHRLEVLRFRQRVRESVLRRFYTAKHYRTLQDMVIEEQVPDIGTLGVSLLKTVEPRRPLKPARTQRKKAASQNLTEGSVTILVSVVRAYNLPTRDKQQMQNTGNPLTRTIFGGSNQPAPETDSNQIQLSPFVSVSFQGNVKATSVAEGPNPNWNEEIVVPFSAPSNDYSPDNMQTVDDMLFVHVFDRVVSDVAGDNRERRNVGEASGAATGVVSHRIQNHWLGTLKIPFSTVYQRGKIEGTFKLNIPAIMLGYSTHRPQPSTDPYALMQNQFLQPQEGSYLTIYVTLEPQLGRLEPVPQKFETQEEQKLIDQSIRFVEECKRKFPNRKIKTTVIDIKGESVFITRYVKPIAPPPSLLSGGERQSLQTLERLARYVSLIPFVSDNVIYAGTCDLWSTCDQFMSMLCGDEEEHAVLLLNFFLHVGIRAFLVLGNAIPEGDTAYVLTHEQGQDFLLWNASNGHHYKSSDSLCPLQNVYGLINQDNVWFNMQTHDAPSRMSFNVSAPGWRPLFRSASATQGLSSVQPDALVFPDTEVPYVQRLEEKIERALKDAIMGWRPRHVTRWNRSCSSALKLCLEGMEKERYGTASGGDHNRRYSRDDHVQRLRDLIGDARFIGFPMEVPFTDIEAVVKAVRSTEVHKIQDNDIEFALSVHVHPYPASVLCVWVYLAAIHSRRQY